jgi:MFS family permease
VAARSRASVRLMAEGLGRKRLLLGGIALFTLASVACGAAPTLDWLIAARTAQGLGLLVLAGVPSGHTPNTAASGRA